MEVKIGVLHAAREISFESKEDPENIEAAVIAAVASGKPLRLLDERGSVIIVPVSNLGYIEIGAAKRGGVGFGTL